MYVSYPEIFFLIDESYINFYFNSSIHNACFIRVWEFSGNRFIWQISLVTRKYKLEANLGRSYLSTEEILNDPDIEIGIKKDLIYYNDIINSIDNKYILEKLKSLR